MPKSVLRDMERDYAKIVPFPREIENTAKRKGYDTCLKIVLYGEPFSDSRPKMNKITGGVVLVNMEKFKPIFNELYRKSELLQNLTIISPFHIYINFFMSPIQKDLKRFKKDPKLMKMFMKEELIHLYRQDVDNMYKIHNDILFVDDRFITLTDSFNTGILASDKVLSPNPRVEMYICYTSNIKRINKYYMEVIQRSSDWRDYLISIKNMNQNKRTPTEQFKHLEKLMISSLEDCGKDRSRIIKYLGTIGNKLQENYPADLIKDMAGIDKDLYSKLNKENAIYKLLLLLTKKNPIAQQIIKAGGKNKIC